MMPSSPVETIICRGDVVTLTSIDPAKNRYRFYTLSWQPTLFGQWALLCHWGRLGTTGRVRATIFSDPESGQEALAEILRRRQAHGYQPSV